MNPLQYGAAGLPCRSSLSLVFDLAAYPPPSISRLKDNADLVFDLDGGAPVVVFDLKGVQNHSIRPEEGSLLPGIWSEGVIPRRYFAHRG